MKILPYKPADGNRNMTSRADAATCQSKVIICCEAKHIRFVIRAKMDSSLKDLMSAIKPSE